MGRRTQHPDRSCTDAEIHSTFLRSISTGSLLSKASELIKRKCYSHYLNTSSIARGRGLLSGFYFLVQADLYDGLMEDASPSEHHRHRSEGPILDLPVPLYKIRLLGTATYRFKDASKDSRWLALADEWVYLLLIDVASIHLKAC